MNLRADWQRSKAAFYTAQTPSKGDRQIRDRPLLVLSNIKITNFCVFSRISFSRKEKDQVKSKESIKKYKQD
ncbi:hypothetical protein ACQ4M3_30810 [Leptolyngbya sp. AN03gr2]|uniref:hypothetical protein n=1 Tax=unclassified Leptolyngbya TaxID=2650499 RepID=UPI003D31C345